MLKTRLIVQNYISLGSFVWIVIRSRLVIDPPNDSRYGGVVPTTKEKKNTCLDQSFISLFSYRRRQDLSGYHDKP